MAQKEGRMGRPVECIFWAPAKGRVVCWGGITFAERREREESEGGLGEGEREEAPGGLVCAVAGRGPPWFQEEEEKPRIPSPFSLSPFSSSTFRSPPPSSLRERRRRRMGGNNWKRLTRVVVCPRPPPLEFRNISSVFPGKTIRNQAVLSNLPRRVSNRPCVCCFRGGEK